MLFLTNVSVARRLLLGFAIVFALWVASTLAGLRGLNSVYGAASKAIQTDVVRGELSNHIRVLILTARRYEKDAFINLNASERHLGYVKKWRDNHLELQATIATLEKLSATDSDRQAVTELGQALLAYSKGFESTLSAIGKGQIGTAEDANREFEGHKQAVHAMESTSTGMSMRASKAVAAIAEPLAMQHRNTVALQIGLALVSVSIAAGIGFAISRSITRQLGGEPTYAAEVARRIADGDLSVPVTLRPGNAESLLAAMAQMQSGLEAMVAHIRRSSEAIAQSSGQIASGNEDLAQRTETQGSNLEQTAASMEQLTSTVTSNADLAREAAQLANGVREDADHCGQLVAQVVEAMNHISGSSTQISDIIGVIDGIAFQTNILALNAAVEAARAGEQGRGFAVVASEVRVLAQRSAGAAREIKKLIGVSGDQVAAGAGHVREAGTAMSTIVRRVHTVAELINQISQATREQSMGIGQVGQAVNQLDQVTQQNAALVEESSAAANSLNQQATQLVQAVSRFRLQHT
jgi:methyl-accepting chemotaxis protein